jgi:DNA-binding transcriptional MocR family regulator
MQTHTRIYTSQAPHVVGQEALLEFAIDDFLRRTTRLKPWRKARYEALLENLDDYLEDLLKRPTPLNAFVTPLTDNWLEQVPNEQHLFARELLEEFETYLVEWAWLEALPTRVS